MLNSVAQRIGGSTAVCDRASDFRAYMSYAAVSAEFVLACVIAVFNYSAVICYMMSSMIPELYPNRPPSSEVKFCIAQPAPLNFPVNGVFLLPIGFIVISLRSICRCCNYNAKPTKSQTKLPV